MNVLVFFLGGGKRGRDLSGNCFSNLTYNSWLMMGANFHFYSDTLTGIKLHSVMAGAQVESEAFV